MTREKLQELFLYSDGHLIWKVDNRANKTKGKRAGFPGGCAGYQYLQTSIEGILYKNHRLIYLYHHGKMPKVIDHINGNTLDNRIENLREASTSQNACNRKINVNNTSGIKGVCWSKASRKWRVRICKDGKRITIGYFERLLDAEFAANTARLNFHGEFARHA